MNVERLKSNVEQLRWRRDKLLQLSAVGHNQHEIAKILQVALGTINLAQAKDRTRGEKSVNF